MTDRRASSSIDHTSKWVPWKLVGSKIEWQEPTSLEQHLEQQEMDPTEEQARRERRKAERKQRRLDRCCAKVDGSRKRIGGVLDWLDGRYPQPSDKALVRLACSTLAGPEAGGLIKGVAEGYRQAAGIGPTTWWFIAKLVIAVIKWWLAYRDEAEE